MSSKSSTVVEAVAHDFAWRAGRTLERVLLDRAFDVAEQSDCSIVTIEHVGSCLDGALFEQLLDLMRKEPDAGRAPVAEIGESAPCEAA